jgi:hypothetical protein
VGDLDLAIEFKISGQNHPGGNYHHPGVAAAFDYSNPVWETTPTQLQFSVAFAARRMEGRSYSFLLKVDNGSGFAG